MTYSERYAHLTEDQRGTLLAQIHRKLTDSERVYLWGVVDGLLTRTRVFVLVFSVLSFALGLGLGAWL